MAYMAIQGCELTTDNCSRCATKVSYFTKTKDTIGNDLYVCKCGREFTKLKDPTNDSPEGEK